MSEQTLLLESTGHESSMPNILRSRTLAASATLAMIITGANVMAPMSAAQAPQTCQESSSDPNTVSTTCSSETDTTITFDSGQATNNSNGSGHRDQPQRPEHQSNELKRHYSLNMHKYNKILSARGCGILALSTAISFQRQKETSPYKVWDRVDNVFTKSGEIKKNEYMRVAAPQAAKHYGLKAHQSSLDFTISNIEQGASVIMLATGTPDGTITRSSHYFEADEAKNGKVHIHDPNQKPGRKFNDSWRSIGWLKKHNTRDHTWVIESE
jgi:hypothetical protein